MQQIRRKVRDTADARRLLDDLRLSKLSLADFAERRGVDGRSLNMYRLNLESAGRTRDAVRLVELVPTAAPTASWRPVRYVVRCGEFAVEVDAEFDEDVLRRLIAVVASC